MPTFIMLSCLATDALCSPQTLEAIECEAMDYIHAECPEVESLHSYAVLGQHDYLNILNTPDIETTTKVSTLIRTFGHVQTEAPAS